MDAFNKFYKLRSNTFNHVSSQTGAGGMGALFTGISRPAIPLTSSSGISSFQKASGVLHTSRTDEFNSPTVRKRRSPRKTINKMKGGELKRKKAPAKKPTAKRKTIKRKTTKSVTSVKRKSPKKKRILKPIEYPFFSK